MTSLTLTPTSFLLNYWSHDGKLSYDKDQDSSSSTVKRGQTQYCNTPIAVMISVSNEVDTKHSAPNIIKITDKIFKAIVAKLPSTRLVPWTTLSYQLSRDRLNPFPPLTKTEMPSWLRPRNTPMGSQDTFNPANRSFLCWLILLSPYRSTLEKSTIIFLSFCSFVSISWVNFVLFLFFFVCCLIELFHFLFTYYNRFFYLLYLLIVFCLDVFPFFSFFQ